MRYVWTLLLCFSLPYAARPQEKTVRVGVLRIFHPQELALAADSGGELLVSAGGQRRFVRPRSSCSVLTIRGAGSQLLVDCGGKEIRTTELHASGRNQEFAGLTITVPGKLTRRYEGVLEVKAQHGELVPVVTMDLEVAVASVVRAETAPDSHLEALKAQAVVSRSYFSAGGKRHADFDFCDLTHCQFLREAPNSDSAATRAALATRGLVLTYRGKPVAAMFTRSCSGRTRTPEEIGLPINEYPYFSVQCDVCYRNPLRWTRTLPREDAMLLVSRGENGRLQLGRRLGWDAVPSNDFEVHDHGQEVTLEGVGSGHGVGLCQRGARNMAEVGADFRAILDHYFPNTRLEELVVKP